MYDSLLAEAKPQLQKLGFFFCSAALFFTCVCEHCTWVFDMTTLVLHKEVRLRAVA